MTKKVFLTLVALLAMGQSAFAYDFSAVAPSGQTLYFNIVDDHAEVVRPGTGSSYNDYISGDVVIPASVTYNGTTYAVTSLAAVSNYGSFENCTGLTSVDIPSSITTIDKYAFYKCSGLTFLSIPSSVTTIGNSAFSNCSSLPSVTIPSSITSIGSSAFSNVRHIEYYGSATGSPWGAITMNGMTEGDFVYSDATKHYLLAYLGGGGSVTIPSTVDTIGNKAFYYCSSLTAVTIPSSVTSIGNSAFYNCSGLISVTIPSSVTSIGNSAFYNCSGLISVTIPSSVTSIGSYAFFNVRHIEYYGNATGSPWDAISMNGVTEGDFVFSDSTRYYLLAYLGAGDTVTIPSTVYIIGEKAFYGCTGLTSVNIPNSVGEIGNSAFSGCSGLTSVNIPNSVYSIGNFAFSNVRHIEYYGNAAGSPWGAITMNGVMEGDFFYSDTTKHNLKAYFGTGDTVIIPSTVITIEDKVFDGCSTLTSVTIPSGVTSIGTSAFRNCKGLTAVLFNATNCSSMGSSGYPAFSGCTNLLTLTIGENVTIIPDYAFSGCSGLTVVTIPSSVTSIGNNAFIGCSGLNSIVVAEGNTHYDSRDNCNAIIQTDINLLIQGCANTIIPNTVSSIDNNAFYNCNGLISVNIPNGVTSIGNYAFQNCSGLTTITIPDSVTSIGNNAFQNCSGLTTIEYNATNCTSMGSSYYYSVFRGCTNLSTLTISENVTIIPNYAFSGCSGIISVNIPNSVTSIGISAFDGCSSLTSTTIGSGVTTIGNDAFYGCSGLTSVTIPSSVTSIGNSAFYGCSSLSSVTIGSGVITIGNSAFDGCSGLTEISSQATIAPSLGTSSFNGIPSTIPIYIPCGSQMSYYSRWSYFSNFIEDDGFTFSVTSSDSTKGYVTIMTSPTCQAPTAVFHAIASSGYVFDHWSDGNTETPRTITQTSDTTITAFFSLLVYDTVFVHDTTILTDTITLTEYVPVHDTTFVPVHDTTTLYDTLTITEYVPIHDTTIRTDTLYLPVYLHDTSYVAVHDTTYIDVPYPVHDTTYIDVHDTTYITLTDTMTVTQYDTITNTVFDTVTNTVFDTIDNYIYDTLTVTDTLWLTEYLYDTIYLPQYIHDTIIIRDTIVVGVGEVEAINAKIYTSHGQIVVEGTEDNTVWLYDINGRILATKQDEYSALHFDVPASGTYLIKVGHHPARRVVVIK